MGGSRKGNCKYCGEYFGNKYNHQNICPDNPDKATNLMCDLKQEDGTIGCGKGPYKNTDQLKEHKSFCLGKPCHLNEPCNEMLYSSTRYYKHVHFTCKLCKKSISNRDKVRHHQNSHPPWGKKYSRALELLLAADKETTKRAEILMQKFLSEYPDLDKHSEEKRYGSYGMFKPVVGQLSFTAQFMKFLAYLGRTSYSRNKSLHGSRYYAHNCKDEDSKKLLDLYDECKANGTNVIFIELYKNCSSVKAGIIETLLLLTVGWWNLSNLKRGDALPLFFDDWSIDDCALLGAKLLQNAIEELKLIDIDSHPKITHHRQAESKSKKRKVQKVKNNAVVSKIQITLEMLEQMNAFGPGNSEIVTFADGTHAVQAVDGSVHDIPTKKPKLNNKGDENLKEAASDKPKAKEAASDKPKASDGPGVEQRPKVNNTFPSRSLAFSMSKHRISKSNWHTRIVGFLGTAEGISMEKTVCNWSSKQFSKSADSIIKFATGVKRATEIPGKIIEVLIRYEHSRGATPAKAFAHVNSLFGAEIVLEDKVHEIYASLPEVVDLDQKELEDASDD